RATFVERERERLFAERRLPRLHRGNHHVFVRVRGADDHDRVDIAVAKQFLRMPIRSRHLEFRGNSARQFRIGIRYRRELGFSQARRQVARVDTPESPETNQSNLQLHFLSLSLAAFSFVIKPMRTPMSAGTASPFIAFTAAS